MAQPPNPRSVAPPPHSSSVARSLANAAAALRAQEWRGANSIPISNANVDSIDAIQRPTYMYADRRSDAGVAAMAAHRQAPRYNRWEEENATSYDARYSHQDVEQENTARYDRQAFYAELRERHRNLTQRQRIAREFYGQRLQQQEPQKRKEAISETSNGYITLTGTQESAKRQRRHHQLVAPVDTVMARHYRSTSYPPRVNTPGPVQIQRTASLEPARPAPLIQVPDTVSDTRTPMSQSPSNGARTEENNNLQTDPSIIEDLENEVENNAEDDTITDQKKQKKRVRYLRDTDRRNIIKRIENGEKQAALAREFGVTRAAICHIKKNRFEILSRYNMLVKSAQEMDRAENFVGPPGVEMMVHEVRANSVLLLMTMLRDNRSNGATFRRVAGRLIMILLEEALAVLGTESVEVITGTGHLYRGLERKYQFCGVAIGAEGFPFLVLFHQMEPEAPQGSIHVEAGTDRQGQRVWRLDHMDLPANIVQHKVLLFSSTCSTGGAECKAMEALCSVGCDERSITLVVILAASDGIVNISNRFPQVKIITGGIDDKVNPQTDSIVPGFGDFVSRYNGS